MENNPKQNTRKVFRFYIRNAGMKDAVKNVIPLLCTKKNENISYRKKISKLQDLMYK